LYALQTLKKYFLSLESVDPECRLSIY